MLPQEGMPLRFLQVLRHHLRTHLLRGDLRLPAQHFPRSTGVTLQAGDLRRAEVAPIHAHNGVANRQGGGLVALNTIHDAHFIQALALKAQLQSQLGGAPADEFAHGILLAGGNYEVLGVVLLEHQPLHAHVVPGVAPVAERVHVAHVQAALQALGNIGEAAGDLSGDEGFPAAGRLVVEQDTVAGVHAVGFAVVHRDPVGVELGDGIGRAGIEGCGLALGGFPDQPIEFGGRRLVEARVALQVQQPDGFEDTQRAHGVDISGILR